MHHLFCITHLPQIAIDLEPTAIVVWLGPSGKAPNIGHQVLDVHEIDPDLMAWHPFLTGAAGAFAIRRFLAGQQKTFADDDLITLTQYRKFISPQAFGHVAVNYPTMRVIDDHASVPCYEDWFVKPKNLFCIPNLINVGNTFLQYAHAHHASDLLRYLAVAVELEAISYYQCHELINNPVMIPGGIELGTFPVSTYLSVVQWLEAVCLRFLELHRPTRLDAYQRRALAFCNERLGSFMLQKVLHGFFNNTIPSDILGHMHTVDIGVDFYRAGT